MTDDRTETLRATDPVPGLEQPHFRLSVAMRALARCVITTTTMLAQHRLRQPTRHVGDVLHFADGTTARVYRETVAERPLVVDPAVLIVEFRLRWVRGNAGHAAFRAESLLNTPLFAGFPGFVSKLWLAHDENGVYRGFYQWDGPGSASAYVRALWWVLAMVSVRDSIHYVVLPGLWRDDLLNDPSALEAVESQSHEWWRLTQVTPRPHPSV